MHKLLKQRSASSFHMGQITVKLRGVHLRVSGLFNTVGSPPAAVQFGDGGRYLGSVFRIGRKLPAIPVAIRDVLQQKMVGMVFKCGVIAGQQRNVVRIPIISAIIIYFRRAEFLAAAYF
ncbi:hypothetical protein D1872_242270 [compost metagenome]